MILLLALFSPLTELFPNLYMSWWAPSNGDLASYLRKWYLRVGVVLVVWLPILFVLAEIAHPLLLLLIALLILGAFGWRLRVFAAYLHAEIDGEDASSACAERPERVYVVALILIFATIYASMPDHHWRVPVAALGIFGGAQLIGRFRRGPKSSEVGDVFGRIVFSGGFLLNLHNLALASELL